MPSRNASLNVSLRTGSFSASLGRMKGMAQGAGKTMGVLIGRPMAQGFRAGVSEMRKSLGDIKKDFGNLADKAKETFGMAATLGGAVSVAGLVQSAVEGQKAYTELGIQMTKVEGKTISAARVQGMIENAAKRSRIAVDDLVDVAGDLKDVGVEKFEDALVRSQMQAKRLGLDAGMLASIYKITMTKGLADSAEEAEILAERIANIDDDKLNADLIREFATQMGVAGGSASRMLNVLETVGGQIKDFKSANEMVKQFGQSFGSVKGVNDLAKAAGVQKIKFDANKSAFENFVDTVESGSAKSQKVVTAFMKSFGNEKAQKMLETLLGRDLVIKLAEGKASKLEMAESAKKLRDLYEAEYDATADRARIEQSNNEMLNTASAKYQAALNRLQEAFRSPKVIGAIEKLADKLPALAEGIAGLIEVVVDHPGESLAAVVMAKVGLGMASAFGSAAIQKAGEAGMKALFNRLMVVQAASAATSAAGGTTGVLGAMGLGGTAVGAKTAGAAMATTGLAVAGAGLAGAGVGYGIYKYGMEKKQEQEFDTMASAGRAVTDARMAKSPEQIRAALDNLSKAKGSLEEDRSLTNTIFGGIASAVTGGPSPAEMRSQRSADIEREQQRLREELSRLRESATAASSAMRAIAGSATSARGPLRSPDPTPGSRPVGG